MAHFFLPTQPGGVFTTAANGAALSELVIRPGAPVRVGLWGAGPNGDPLDVRAYQGGRFMTGLAPSPARFTRTTNDPKQKVQVYTVTGLRDGDVLVGLANGILGTQALPVYELRNTPSGLMREAAQWYGKPAGGPQTPGICPHAIPYLAMRDAAMGGMTVLRDSTAGGPLVNVHGLAVHTTAGTDARSPYQMARWGCVEGWNQLGVSAHFGIAGDGTLVQFVPVNYIAYAQYSPGNEHWISVEVDNDGKALMTARQLTSLEGLFRWVADSFGIPRRVSTGCLFPKTPQFDWHTEKVCDRGNAETTTDPYVACMSRGVSCHWWLEARKTNNSHACPGPGILSQLDRVAHG